MRKPSLALVPVLLFALAGCDQPDTSLVPAPAGSTLSSHPEEAWRVAVGLPTAAAACRAAGYPAEEIEEVVEMSRRVGIEPAAVAEALAITAQAAEAYGPIGDLSGYMAETLYRSRLRGEPLFRLIIAQHAAYGAYQMDIPHQQTPMPEVPPTGPNRVDEWQRDQGDST